MLPLEDTMTDHDTGHTDELVRRCQQGDQRAFNELVLQEQERMYQLAYRITRSREELDDLVQDIFLRVYRKIRTFRFESQFSTWLTRVAVNESLKKLRQRKRRALLFASEPEIEEMPKERSLHATVHLAERDEEHALLHRAVDRLPEKHRLVIVLKYFEDRSCEEIAEILRCNVGTVRSRLFNARKRLKDMMQKSHDSL